jgi:RNA polymerase sigma factor (sigma-70 family)
VPDGVHAPAAAPATNRCASRLQAWIITTAQREAWLQRRRAARSVSMNRPAGHGDEDTEWLPADDSPGPDEIVAHWQQMARVRRAFERLDERCRELLQALFGSEAVGYDELARRLGVPVGSIGPTRARCLAKLRRMVE